MKARSLFFTLLMILSFSLLVNAQTTKVDRPSDINVSDFDSFKNTSFDILQSSVNLKSDFTTLDDAVKKYSGVISTIAPDKLRKDLAAFKGIGKESETLMTKIGDLNTQGQELLGKAKDIQPRLKSPAATSLTNKSIKGLGDAKTNISSVTSLLEGNITLLTDELKKRGEPIE